MLLRMELNGWKRIGIIASIAWILGGGVYGHEILFSSDSKAAVSASLDCEKYISEGITTLPECDKRMTDYLAGTYSGEWLGAAAVSFVPVPLGWGLVYLVRFLVRWIDHGFEK